MQRFLQQVESLQEVRSRLTDHLNRLTVKELLPLILIYADGTMEDTNKNYPNLESRIKLTWLRHIIPLSPEKMASSSSQMNIIECAVRFLTQNDISTTQLPTSTSPSLPRRRSHSDLLAHIPNVMQPTAWLDRFCRQNSKSIFAWNYDDREDSLVWHFFCDGQGSKLVAPPATDDICTKVKWFQQLLDKGQFYFFVIYDERKRIDLIQFKFEFQSEATNELHLWQCFRESNYFSNQKLEQVTRLTFDWDEVTPALFGASKTMNDLIGSSQLFCRRLSDYKVAAMGTFNPQSHDLSCVPLWSDYSFSHCVFHLILSKYETHAFLDSNQHYVTIMAIANGQEYDIIDQLPLHMLVPLVRNPNFYCVTFILSLQACRSISRFKLAFPSLLTPRTTNAATESDEEGEEEKGGGDY